MNTTRILAGLGTLLLLAAPVAAQETSKDTEKARRDAEAQMKKAEEQMRRAEQQIREAERAMRDAARKMGDLHMSGELKSMERKVVIFGDRARLGLVLQSDKNPKTDAIGAYVEGLTPGSPAEEAGLQPGDIIVKFNGESLASANVEADEEESAPTAKLMELAHDLKDGDKVALEYRRGGETKKVTVTATRAMGPRIRLVTVPEQPLIEIPDIDIPDIDVDVHTTGRPWRDMELVALNPELGEYFATAQGILVVSASKDGPLKLKAGDVILKIGDRTPATPSQAMRILRSYEPGENVALQVMRKREKLTITVQAPRHRSGSFQWQVEPPEPAVAPAVPAAPAAPAKPVAPAAPATPAAKV
jgi:C-terminal processing protease CtpA/Prc